MDMFSDSDFEHYIDSSDNEDRDGIELAYSEHAQNILSCLDESLEKIDDILVFKRGFVHGDIVCSINDAAKQLGRVVDVDMCVDLETSLGELIKDVNSRSLVRVCSFAPRDYVIHRHWLGRVRRIFDRVTVLLNNGSKCEINVRDSDDLMPLFPNIFEVESHPLYYPGQRVSVKHRIISEKGKWACGSWGADRIDATICHVEVGLVHVKWVTSLLCMGCSSSPPDHLQVPEMLTLLSCFPYTNWQIGDCCTLPFDCQNYTKMAEKGPARKKHVHLSDASQFARMLKSRISGQLCREFFSIAKTRIKVDVLWQSGQVSTGVDPEALLPVNNIGEHDFWPGQFVAEKVTYEDVHVLNVQRLGVVKSVESQEQIVKVKWITAELKNKADFSRDAEEIVSAYELIEHPDASYSYCDIVIRLPNCEIFEGNTPNTHIRADLVQEHENLSTRCVLASSYLHTNACKQKVHSSGLDICPISCAACIGFVIGFKDARIEVKWASGLISSVHPYEIVGLDRLDDLNSLSTTQDVENMQDEISQQVKLQDNEVEIDSNGGSISDLRESGLLLLPLAVFRFLTNIAERLFGTSGTSRSSNQQLSNLNCLDKTEINKPSADGDELQFNGWKEAVNCEVEKIERSAVMVESEKYWQFKQFDSVFDCSDHHFTNGISNDATAFQIESCLLKRVHQEWGILKSNLPESIYVRVYEERIDLLRVSIAGQSGTPYDGGLFFFDFQLPSNYPHEPPLVHYHSCGLKLNPNLYESGMICLSLLNTWAGSDTEVWNPNSSTILQVLLSLQALVLNDKPYFNEAGHEKYIGRAEAERCSIKYNENAFLLTCKSMLCILKQPPKHFEALVEEHFAKHASEILQCCTAYLNGAQVGICASRTGSEHGLMCNSAGFRIMLAKIFPRLVSSFTAKGIDCSQFIDCSDS